MEFCTYSSCGEIFVTLLINFKVSKLGKILHVDKAGFLRPSDILSATVCIKVSSHITMLTFIMVASYI